MAKILTFLGKFVTLTPSLHVITRSDVILYCLEQVRPLPETDLNQPIIQLRNVEGGDNSAHVREN
jgi:hypothetical protein